MRKTYYHLLLLLFIAISGTTYAQQTTVKLLASPRQDSILLRFAPANAKTWRLANQYGYKIERTTILSGKKQAKETKATLLTPMPLKPAPLEIWKRYDNEKYPAIAAGCIYGEDENIPHAGNPNITYKKYKAEQQKFSFALYAADQSILTAKLSGLYHADKTVQPDEKYLYKVYINLPDSIMQDTAYAVTGVSEYQPLPKPMELQAIWEENKVTLSWNILYHKHLYNSYILEKSTDGGNTYQAINTNSAVQLADKGVNPHNMYKTDTLPDKQKQYYYRVRGISAFGESSPPSDPVFGRSTKPLTNAPVITSNEVVNNNTVVIHWTYPEDMNPHIAGFKIYRSATPEGKKQVIYNGTAPSLRSYTDSTPSITNYYKIAVSNETSEKLSPTIHFAQLIDSIPPQAPVNILARVDSAGLVTLTWDKNTEKDISGYRVYAANNPKAEFMLITPEPVKTESFNPHYSSRDEFWVGAKK